MRALRGDDAAVPGPRPHGRRARGGRDASRRVLVLPEALPIRGETAPVRAQSGAAGSDARRVEDQARGSSHTSAVRPSRLALELELECISDPRSMDLSFTPMTSELARSIASWRYDGEYACYNLDSSFVASLCDPLNC